MKRSSIGFTLMFQVIPLCFFCQRESSIAADQSEEAASEMRFAGRWDLTIKEGKMRLPSWLELRLDEGIWKGSFVGRWGNARALPVVSITGDQIHFVSPKEEEG